MPSFLLQYSVQLLDRSAALTSAYELLQDQLEDSGGGQIAMLILAGLILYSRKRAIGQALQSVGRWGLRMRRQLFGRMESKEIDDLEEVEARLSDRLLCKCNRTLSMIYPCGHLSTCEECVESGCRLCGRAGPGQRVFT